MKSDLSNGFIKLHIRLIRVICRLSIISMTVPTTASEDMEIKRLSPISLGAAIGAASGVASGAA